MSFAIQEMVTKQHRWHVETGDESRQFLSPVFRYLLVTYKLLFFNDINQVEVSQSVELVDDHANKRWNVKERKQKAFSLRGNANGDSIDEHTDEKNDICRSAPCIGILIYAVAVLIAVAHDKERGAEKQRVEQGEDDERKHLNFGENNDGNRY